MSGWLCCFAPAGLFAGPSLAEGPLEVPNWHLPALGVIDPAAQAANRAKARKPGA